MSVEDTAERIQSMEVRGALRIAVTAAEAMLSEIMGGADIPSLERSAGVLKAARPSAVSLPNAVDYVLYLSRKHEDENTRIKRVEGFIESQRKARQKIAEIGSHLIEEGDVLLTHCNSTAATSVIKAAHSLGRKIRVFATESRPRYQGHLTYKDLSKAGVDVTLIVDSAVNFTLHEKNIDKVIVGADTVYVNGDVINKIGTSQVALAAHVNDVDFMVATESIKFSPQSLLGIQTQIEERDPREVADFAEQVFNPAFDVTPKEHIHQIITEYGVIPPEAAYHILKEHYSWRLEDG
ncbi:MAG: ribose 1,5-bisphosphate isomerase [Candidatus Altiarchaeales archaeon]|nr:ribose 1,5-bisphosphate isomerase [Candidatus Altiarchaeales archaeon]